MTTLYYESNELYHHGIKGMKWGRRRFQNSDGSLTAAGRSRYNGAMTKAGTAMAKSKVGQAGVKAGKAIAKQNQARITKKNAKKGFTEDSYNENKGKMGKVYDKVTGAHKYGGDLKYAMASKSEREARARKYEADQAAYKQSDEYKAKVEKRKKALKIGAAVAGTALVAYGGYKINQAVKDENYRLAVEKGQKIKENHEWFMSNSKMTQAADGTYSVTYLREARWNGPGDASKGINIKEGLTRAEASKIFNEQERRDLKLQLDAQSQINKLTSRAENATFREAARNVYEDRKRRR